MFTLARMPKGVSSFRHTHNTPSPVTAKGQQKNMRALKGGYGQRRLWILFNVIIYDLLRFCVLNILYFIVKYKR